MRSSVARKAGVGARAITFQAHLEEATAGPDRTGAAAAAAAKAFAEGGPAVVSADGLHRASEVLTASKNAAMARRAASTHRGPHTSSRRRRQTFRLAAGAARAKDT